MHLYAIESKIKRIKFIISHIFTMMQNYTLNFRLSSLFFIKYKSNRQWKKKYNKYDNNLK